jgi:hypothetical protein
VSSVSTWTTATRAGERSRRLAHGTSNVTTALKICVAMEPSVAIFGQAIPVARTGGVVSRRG